MVDIYAFACNKECPWLQPKKTLVKVCYLLIYQQKALYMVCITNKTYLFSFKSGCGTSGEAFKKDWL